ncbi:uncharacterized protein LOC105186978 isoform X1 [Harpegnathos saltator]|uniref:uncharacterized protein LOC105186978 isoform X1 n=1 Tax=Harpegnathos saltator TaxID=610380 RepID=UPI00058C0BFE|nr:uncharacterized protein LOC105186978 isoform X1 [Harpegnathos saltator]
MKTHLRRPVAMAPLLLLHLLTLRAGVADTVTKFPDVKRTTPDEIILEEVIISGSGNNTRITANALAEEPSKLGREILALLSKREAHKRSLLSDQDVGESQATTVVRVEEDEDELEKLKRVVAKYEPQRIASRIAKRKITDAPVDVHDTRKTSDSKVAKSTTSGPTTDLESTYHEVLRNISRGIPQLAARNAGVSLTSYLSQSMKNLRRIPTAEVTTRTLVAGGETDRPSLSATIDSPHTLSASKKKKLLLQKYMQPNISPRVPLQAESRFDEGTADITESSKEHLHAATWKPKLKNGSSTESPSSIAVDLPENPGNRRGWNAEASFSQVSPSPFVQPSTNHVFNSNKKQLGLQSNFNSLHSPLKHSKVPRPFSITVTEAAQLLNAADPTTKIATYRKSSSSPAAASSHQAVQPTSIALPLILPTDLFSMPPARRYVPIKRANRDFNPPDGFHVAATALFTNSPATSSPAPYAAVIGATKSPAVVSANSRQSPGYYVITEKPTERRTVAATTTIFPAQSPAPTVHILQRRLEPSQDVTPKTNLASELVYDGGQSEPNSKPGDALYNKFADLYSNTPNADVANVLHVQRPKAVAQDYGNFKQPALPVQASSLPYVTLRPLKPVSPALTRPIAPYYDSSLLLPQRATGGQLGEGNVGTSERSRVEDGDEDEGEGAAIDDKSASGSYRSQVNRGVNYEAGEIAKAPSAVAHEVRHDEDPYRPRSRDDEERQDKQPRGLYDDDDDDDDDDDGGGAGNARDEADAGEALEGEHVEEGGRGSEDEDGDGHYRYDKLKYDRDADEKEQRRKQQRYGASKDYDHQAVDVGFNRRLTASRQQEAARDSRYGKKKRNRDREHEKHEDEGAATEDTSVTRRAKDQRARQRAKYQRKWNHNDDNTYRGHLASPQADSHRQAQYRQEYQETNPPHVRAEYQQRQGRVKDVYRDPRHENNKSQGHGNEEEEHDHVHGETQEHAHKHEEHHDGKKHGGDHKFEAGEGSEHDAEHHGHKGEKGDKGYKVWHENEKAAKGHHDKEHSSKKYDEKEGKEKKHEEEGGYHEHHGHGEKGEKAANFEEKGEHQKGHSTKGEHSVHKKDEYEKKTEFFDEFHEDGGTEKHGEHHHEHEKKKGGHEKKAHHDAEHHEEKHGKEHKYEKGGHHHEHKGHKVDEGHNHHYEHGHHYGDKGNHEHGKKWNYEKGDGHKRKR